jgi:hypothetical protein
METTHGSGYVFKQHVRGFDVPASMEDGDTRQRHVQVFVDVSKNDPWSRRQDGYDMFIQDSELDWHGQKSVTGNGM